MQTDEQLRITKYLKKKQRGVPEGKNGGNEGKEILKNQQNKIAHCQ